MKKLTRLTVDCLDEILTYETGRKVSGNSRGNPCIALNQGEFNISNAQIIPEIPTDINAYSAGKTVGSTSGVSYTPVQFYKIKK